MRAFCRKFRRSRFGLWVDLHAFPERGYLYYLVRKYRNTFKQKQTRKLTGRISPSKGNQRIIPQITEINELPLFSSDRISRQ